MEFDPFEDEATCWGTRGAPLALNSNRAPILIRIDGGASGDFSDNHDSAKSVGLGVLPAKQLMNANEAPFSAFRRKLAEVAKGKNSVRVAWYLKTAWVKPKPVLEVPKSSVSVSRQDKPQLPTSREATKIATLRSQQKGVSKEDISHFINPPPPEKAASPVPSSSNTRSLVKNASTERQPAQKQDSSAQGQRRRSRSKSPEQSRKRARKENASIARSISRNSQQNKESTVTKDTLINVTKTTASTSKNSNNNSNVAPNSVRVTGTNNSLSVSMGQSSSAILPLLAGNGVPDSATAKSNSSGAVPQALPVPVGNETSVVAVGKSGVVITVQPRPKSIPTSFVNLFLKSLGMMVNVDKNILPDYDSVVALFEESVDGLEAAESVLRRVTTREYLQKISLLLEVGKLRFSKEQHSCVDRVLECINSYLNETNQFCKQFASPTTRPNVPAAASPPGNPSPDPIETVVVEMELDSEEEEEQQQQEPQQQQQRLRPERVLIQCSGPTNGLLPHPEREMNASLAEKEIVLTILNLSDAETVSFMFEATRGLDKKNLIRQFLELKKRLTLPENLSKQTEYMKEVSNRCQLRPNATQPEKVEALRRVRDLLVKYYRLKPKTLLSTPVVAPPPAATNGVPHHSRTAPGAPGRLLEELVLPRPNDPSGVANNNWRRGKPEELMLCWFGRCNVCNKNCHRRLPHATADGYTICTSCQRPGIVKRMKCKFGIKCHVKKREDMKEMTEQQRRGGEEVLDANGCVVGCWCSRCRSCSELQHFVSATRPSVQQCNKCGKIAHFVMEPCTHSRCVQERLEKRQRERV